MRGPHYQGKWNEDYRSLPALNPGSVLVGSVVVVPSDDASEDVTGDTGVTGVAETTVANASSAWTRSVNPARHEAGKMAELETSIRSGMSGRKTVTTRCEAVTIVSALSDSRLGGRTA